MCSIFGIFGLQAGDDLPALRRHALELSQRQRHRGPDWSGVYLTKVRCWSTSGWPSSTRPVARSRCCRPMASRRWR